MPGELAVYICTGCGIGDAIDCAKLAKTAKPAAQIHPFLCGPEGLALIRSAPAGRAVIAACSPRAKTDAFAFEHERINLREHVAWSHDPNDEDTQALAEDYLAMGIARARKTAAPDPLAEAVSRRILVVGTGPAGNAAAQGARAAGYEILQLGRDARVAKTEGQPGMFDVTLDSGEIHRAGAIVLAAGWNPYDASRLTHLGFGASPDVITSTEAARMLGNGGLQRPSDGRTPRDVLFIQCAGSRDRDHLPYCSSACCTTTLKQAAQIRAADPDAKVYILYKDIRTPAENERLYRDAQDDPLVFLAKAEIESVAPAGHRLRVTARNTVLGDRIAIDTDLVVLATGMVPNAAGVLHLDYRQGPDLPVLRHDFPDSHFICFPYETRRTGIYAAGAARAPMDEAQARRDGMGAAMKAIQCVEMAARGEAVHPRAGETAIPAFFLQRCTQCKRCTEECPFGALDEDARGTPKPNPYRCRRCGICLGACPERIVGFPDYSVDIVASMIKAIDIPDEEEEKFRILVFMCENDAYPALDIAGLHRLRHDAAVRVLPVRCLGSVNRVWINDAFNGGFDGVLLIGCKRGNDYQCHFVQGSELAATRMENARELLDRMQLERERLEVAELAINEYGRLPGLIDDFVERIRAIGQNPCKGF